jgi:hypothetical protein
MPEVLDSEFLSPAEVRDLAGAANVEGQVASLTALGVPCRRRGNRLLVSRIQVREWLAGRSVAPSRGARLDLVK